MPKVLSFAWVKNVYSLRIARGTNSDKLPTPPLSTRTFTYQPVHKSPVVLRFVQAFTPLFSTLKIPSLYLLYIPLYPQSTPPINKKKKER